MLFAVLLHLALLYYFFNQTFSLAPVETPPSDPPVIMTMDRPQPKPPVPTDKPVKAITVHAPVSTTPTTVEPLRIEPKVDPNPQPLPGPPLIVPGPVVQTPGPVAPPYVTARWTRFPDSNALGQYYPARAANDEVEGAATVECTVLDKAGHVHCTALSEIPGNYGFGKATVQMVQDKGRVDTSQGDVKIGSILRTTVKWKLG
jgi:protein TonB